MSKYFALKATNCKTCKVKIVYAAKECRSCYDKTLKARNPEYKQAQRDNHAKWAAKNRKKLNAYGKTWLAKKDPDWLRDAWLRKKYGISLDIFNEMFESQKGACKICFRAGLTLCVDHCHETGKVRGLLCRRCNYGLGYFSDNLESFKNIIIYLEEHSE
jgi:hypothetical protein